MRLSFLDSIRGLAALIVVCAHIHYAVRSPTVWLDTSVLRVLNASAFAVTVFFILSGFVLFLKIKKDNIGYLPFVVRRAFRILPASAAAITLSWMIYYFWHPSPMSSLGPWFNQVSWPPGITFRMYWDDARLAGGQLLLPQTWSLVEEWRISLIFPLLTTAFVAFPRTVAVVAFGFALGVTGPLLESTQGHWASYAITAFYGSFFVGGMIISMYWREIILMQRCYPIIKSLAGLCMIYFLLFWSQTNGFAGWLFDAMAGFVLLIFCLGSSKARWVLRMRLLRYLGKISYSLYLIHIIWLGVLFRLLDGFNPLLIAALVIGLSIVSADLLYRTIELPFNRLGRAISKRLSWDNAFALWNFAKVVFRTA